MFKITYVKEKIMTKSRELIEVTCDVCGRTYKTLAKEWRYAEKKGRKHCCSKECMALLYRTGKTIKCNCCGKEFYITKKLLESSNVHYCSKKCAHQCINHSHIKTDEQKRKISESMKRFCSTQAFQDNLEKRKSETIKITKKCPVCGKEFQIQNWNVKRIFCSRACCDNDKTFQFHKKTSGGLRKGSSRAYHGWYKGYYCDSSWELAFVIYNLEHGVSFQRNRQGFEYEYKGEKHKFYPDFILDDGTFVEIKGYMGKQNEAKIASFDKSLKVLTKNEIKPYLKYCVVKYGKDFTSLYEKD